MSNDFTRRASLLSGETGACNDYPMTCIFSAGQTSLDHRRHINRPVPTDMRHQGMPGRVRPLCIAPINNRMPGIWLDFDPHLGREAASVDPFSTYRR